MDYLLGILLKYSIYKGYVDKLFRDKRVQKYLPQPNHILLLKIYISCCHSPIVLAILLYSASNLFLIFSFCISFINNTNLLKLLVS